MKKLFNNYYACSMAEVTCPYKCKRGNYLENMEKERKKGKEKNKSRQAGQAGRLPPPTLVFVVLLFLGGSLREKKLVVFLHPCCTWYASG